MNKVMTFGSLYAGIGGFDLGLERVGLKCSWQVEIDEYCQKILTKHWPNVPKYRNVYDCGKGRAHELEPVDLVVGGVPCQPASVAGKQRGTEDDRWLWPETFRIVAELRPRWCLFENVTGLLTLEDGVVFDNLLSELEGQGYEVQAFIVPACAINAPHRRDRVWIVAHSSSDRQQSSGGRRVVSDEDRDNQSEVWRQEQQQGLVGPGDVAHARLVAARNESSGFSSECLDGGAQGEWAEAGNRLADCGEDVAHADSGRCSQCDKGEWGIPEPDTFCSGNNGSANRFSQPPVRDVAHGFPARLVGPGWWDREPDIPRVSTGVKGRVDQLRALGNAVVPQLVEVIGRAILEVDENL